MSEFLKNKVRKILVLEDEPAHAEAIKRHISDADYDCRITVAGSLAAFKEIVSALIPDIVIALPKKIIQRFLSSIYGMDRKRWIIFFGRASTPIPGAPLPPI